VLKFYLQILTEIFLILRRNKRYVIKIFIGLHVMYFLFFTDFIET